MMVQGGSYHTLVRATQNAAAVKKGLSVIGPESYFSNPIPLLSFSTPFPHHSLSSSPLPQPPQPPPPPPPPLFCTRPLITPLPGPHPIDHVRSTPIRCAALRRAPSERAPACRLTGIHAEFDQGGAFWLGQHGAGLMRLGSSATRPCSTRPRSSPPHARPPFLHPSHPPPLSPALLLTART